MKASNELTLSEAVKYYEDFDGELEESLFNWLVERAKKAEEYETTLKEIANNKENPASNIAKKLLDS